MTEPAGGNDARAELRHALNNRLNALSMQAELALHFLHAGDTGATDSSLRKIIADCRRYSDELGGLLRD